MFVVFDSHDAVIYSTKLILMFFFHFMYIYNFKSKIDPHAEK